MESRKIGKDQFKLQIKSCRNIKDTQRSTMLTSPLLSCPMVESTDDLRSPTFLNESFVIEEENDLEKIIFKFGLALRQEMGTLVESKKVEEKLEPLQYASSVPFQSFCKSPNENLIDRSKVVSIFQKFSRFYEDTMRLFESVRVNLKDYQNYLTSQQGYLTNFLKVAIENIQIRQTEKSMNIQKEMEELKKQNFVYVEKIKFLEEESYSLKQNLTEVIQITERLKSEKIIYEKNNKKLSELNEELQKKNRLISNLQLENQKSNSQLKKFVCLANSVNKGGNQTSSCQKLEKPHTFRLNLNANKMIQDRETIANFKQSGYSTISTASKYQVSNSRLSSKLYTQQNGINSPLTPFLHQKSVINLASNSTALREKNTKEKVIFSFQKPKIDQKFGQGAKKQQKLAQPKRYSWQMSTQAEEIRNKKDIMQRIRKLRDHLNTEIKDIRSERY